jgi:hypothetical protein
VADAITLPVSVVMLEDNEGASSPDHGHLVK